MRRKRKRRTVERKGRERVEKWKTGQEGRNEEERNGRKRKVNELKKILNGKKEKRKEGKQMEIWRKERKEGWMDWKKGNEEGRKAKTDKKGRKQVIYV